MAKKKDNTLLYAGIAAAALLLFKKKDSGMAGVGAAQKTKLIMDGDFQLVKYAENLLSNYIDSYTENISNDGLFRIFTCVFPSVKIAREEAVKFIRLLKQDGFIVKEFAGTYYVRKGDKRFKFSLWK